MQKIIIYIGVFLISIASKAIAQDKSFEQKAKEIGLKIKTATEEEKQALKNEVEAIDNAFEFGKITKSEAAEAKSKVAEECAKNIETKVAAYETELSELINSQVQTVTETLVTDTLKNNTVSIPGGFKGKKDENKSENKTTTQFVFATGFNNLVTDGAVANSNFGYLRSTFYEWGVTWNTRLSKNSNLVHFKYGAGFMYNMLHATGDRVFEDKGTTTVLVSTGINYQENKTYFKNVYFVVPMHFEFDFSKTKMVDDAKVFKSHRGVRIGIGGFVGFNTNSKQFKEYKLDGYKYKIREKGDFNVNDITYGLSAYIGHKQTSLYVKYDLNPMFKNNVVDQNNISLGIRFDLN